MSVVVYENALGCAEDISDFFIEGLADISFASGAMRVKCRDDVVIWCPKALPADIRIDWEYRPVKEPGSSELIFSAKQSEDGDGAKAYLLSFFERRDESEMSFHTGSLYKTSEDVLLFRGADPLPGASEDLPWYHMTMVKRVKDIYFGINNMEVLHFHDDGQTHGEILTGGNMAFRQSGRMCAEYRNVKVTWI